MMTREKDKPREQVMLIKIQLIQCLFGIRSMRQTIKDIEVNIAYRWFLGLSLMDPVPHFTTFGKNYTRRFKDTDLYEQIFASVLEDCRNCPYLAQCTLSKNHQKLVTRLRRVKHFPEGDQHLLRHTVICKNTDFRHRCYGKDTGLPDLNQRLTHGCGQSSASKRFFSACLPYSQLQFFHGSCSDYNRCHLFWLARNIYTQ